MCEQAEGENISDRCLPASNSASQMVKSGCRTQGHASQIASKCTQTKTDTGVSQRLK